MGTLASPSSCSRERLFPLARATQASPLHPTPLPPLRIRFMLSPKYLPLKGRPPPLRVRRRFRRDITKNLPVQNPTRATARDRPYYATKPSRARWSMVGAIPCGRPLKAALELSFVNRVLDGRRRCWRWHSGGCAHGSARVIKPSLTGRGDKRREPPVLPAGRCLPTSGQVSLLNTFAIPPGRWH